MDYSPPGSSVHEILECFGHSLLQEIFLTEGSDPGLHCRQALYCLNHQGRPSATPHTDLGVQESCAHPERDGTSNAEASCFIAGGPVADRPLGEQGSKHRPA